MNYNPYYESWVESAPCRSVGGDVWFPETGDANWQRAQQVCRGCPVLVRCLESVMRAELGVSVKHRFGIWAGMSPNQRSAFEPVWLAEQGSAA